MSREIARLMSVDSDMLNLQKENEKYKQKLQREENNSGKYKLDLQRAQKEIEKYKEEFCKAEVEVLVSVAMCINV